MGNTALSTEDVMAESSIHPTFYWRVLVYLARYREVMAIREVMVFPNDDAYYVCPRCYITLEREFMAYCDRCGQHLGWKGYRNAKVVYPGKRKQHA